MFQFAENYCTNSYVLIPGMQFIAGSYVSKRFANSHNFMISLQIANPQIFIEYCTTLSQNSS